MSSFTYRRNAREEELRELCREISPLETAGLSVRERRALPGLVLSAARKCRTYVVRIDSRLAGVCFVDDFADRREMAFTKTRYLTEERRLTFAKEIWRLLVDLARFEREAGRDAKPMYMHVPDGDERSAAWFVRAGCVLTERGLLCPQQERGS